MYFSKQSNNYQRGLTGKTLSSKTMNFDAFDIKFRTLMEAITSAVESLDSVSVIELLKSPEKISMATSWVAPSPFAKF